MSSASVLASPSDTITQREFWAKLGLSRSQYYRLKDEGWFTALEAPPPLKHRYSRVKVDVYLHGRQFVDPLRRVS